MFPLCTSTVAEADDKLTVRSNAKLQHKNDKTDKTESTIVTRNICARNPLETKRIESRYDHDAKVVYGDTDSVMVKFGDSDLGKTMKLGTWQFNFSGVLLSLLLT